MCRSLSARNFTSRRARPSNGEAQERLGLAVVLHEAGRKHWGNEHDAEASPSARSRGQYQARRAGIEPAVAEALPTAFPIWRRAFRHWNFRRMSIAIQCVGRDLNPHVSPKRGRGYGPLHCHSATYASLQSQRGRIRTSNFSVQSRAFYRFELSLTG